MKKRFLSLMLAALMVTGLVACGNGSTTEGGTTEATDAAETEQPADDGAAGIEETTNDTATTDKATTSGDTIKIGGLAPLTGNVSQYGIASSNGSTMYINELNAAGGIGGQIVEFILEDEKGDTTEAVNATNKLIQNDGVIAIIGDVTSGPAAAAAQVAATSNMPMIAPTATAAEVTTYGTNVFRACFLDPYQGTTMGNFAKEKLNASTAAVIFNNADEYSLGLKDSFVETCEAAGITVVATESYNTDDVDFRSQLSNIASKSPDVLFVPDYYNTVVNIVSQARENGLDIPCLGADGWDGVLNVATDVTTLENCYFSNHYSTEDEDPVVQNFLKNYEAEYGETPNSFAALGYDAAMIMCKAIETAGSTNPDDIIAALKGMEIDGVTGHITFDENGDPQKSCAIILIKDGAYTLFEKF